jgi:hypothetical protein
VTPKICKVTGERKFFLLHPKGGHKSYMYTTRTQMNTNQFHSQMSKLAASVYGSPNAKPIAAHRKMQTYSVGQQIVLSQTLRDGGKETAIPRGFEPGMVLTVTKVLKGYVWATGLHGSDVALVPKEIL